MNDCIFCKIVAGDIPSERIYEDDAAFAFLDIHPNNKGHTLVIPKNHCVNIYDFPDEALSGVIRAVKKVSIAVKKAMNADGINLGMNNDGAAGQLVFHAHIHVIPRFSNDGLKHWHGRAYENGEIEEFGKKIRSEITQ
jgi:histidine triad (HIT) family protein